jgi:hypothetical protein
MPLSMDLFATLSIMTFSINNTQHNSTGTIILIVIILNVVMLNVVMLSVIMLNVVMLNVVAPQAEVLGSRIGWKYQTRLKVTRTLHTYGSNYTRKRFYGTVPSYFVLTFERMEVTKNERTNKQFFGVFKGPFTRSILIAIL